MPYNPDGSFTLPTGATNAFAGQTIASATWNATFTDIQNALSHNLGVRVFAARTVNFNPSVATDTAINVSVTTVNYRVTNLTIANASATLTTAQVGLFTAVSAGGIAVIGTGVAVTVSSSLPDTLNNIQIITPSISMRSFSDATLQFRIVVAQGGPATADVLLTVVPQ